MTQDNPKSKSVVLSTRENKVNSVVFKGGIKEKDPVVSIYVMKLGMPEILTAKKIRVTIEVVE